MSCKSCFVLLHKLREAMAEEMKGRTLGGAGKVAEIDGGYFSGYVKPGNWKEHRRDRRKAENQNGKRAVMDDSRSWDHVCTLRAVISTHGNDGRLIAFDCEFLACVASWTTRSKTGLCAPFRERAYCASRCEWRASRRGEKSRSLKFLFDRRAGKSETPRVGDDREREGLALRRIERGGQTRVLDAAPADEESAHDPLGVAKRDGNVAISVSNFGALAGHASYLSWRSSGRGASMTPTRDRTRKRRG